MGKNRVFFRIIFSVGLIIILGFIAGGLGKIIAFFEKGREKEVFIDVVPGISSVYTPKFIWEEDDENTGREMEDFTRDIIEHDYVSALYQRNIAILNRDSLVLSEYFTNEAKVKISDLVKDLIGSNHAVQKAEMNHRVNLHFYSADGQLISFTDRAVESRQRVIDLKTDGRILSDVDTADYKVIMQLVDGYWKIKHMVRQPMSEELSLIDTINIKGELDVSLLETLNKSKGINYYPKETPWKEFWTNYEESIIEKDFELIAGYELNSVRVFVNFEQFGKGRVVPEMLERLQHLLDTAEKNGLHVILTLFDFNSDYRLMMFPACDRQMETIMKRFRSHPALLAWDLKNEPDIDFVYQNAEDVKEWLAFMISKAKLYDPVHPITIGWAHPESVQHFAEDLDFISFHYYRDVEDLEETIDTLKAIANGKPLILEEFGLSSYESWLFPLSVTEHEQASHLKKVLDILKMKGDIPYSYWALYDFDYVGSDIAGSRPWQRSAQKHFGIIGSDGKDKPVAQVFIKDELVSSKGFFDYIPKYIITYILLIFIFVSSALFYRKVR